MSTSGNYIVDTQASLEEAPQLAQRVVDWLLERGIINPSPRIGADGEVCAQYGPGPRAALAGEDVYTEVQDCGLNVQIGRMVFTTGEDGVEELGCPACGHLHREHELDWLGAVENWYRRSGSDDVTCAACGQSASITDWQLDPRTGRGWGFGHLGFEFGQFILSEAFIEEIRQVLGHSVRRVHFHY